MAESPVQFIIAREGAAAQAVDKDDLLLGRLSTCDLQLEHPAVSRVHAGINFLDGRFYIINLSNSNFVTVNGRRIAPGETDIVVDGDLLLVGPFAIRVEIAGGTLTASVKMAVEADMLHMTQRLQRPNIEGIDTERANVLKVFWEKRSRNKDDWGSRLRPTAPPEPGKARINWKPTRDLRRAWRYGVFVWTALVLASVAVFAYFSKPDTFSPMPLSSPHLALASERGIAGQPNANSCTTCHRPDTPIETACASCHQGENFHASNLQKHQDAGVSCVSCHSEHRGADFKSNPVAAGSCSECHNDANKNSYRGKRVGAPHGSDGYLYPVVGGTWTWNGVDKVLAPQMPEVLGSATGDRDAQEKASRQFHAVHVGRLKAPAGLGADSRGLVSCSTCHKAFDPIDVVTPKQTCATCHVPKTPTADGMKADCITCHVQHPYSADRWNGFLTPDALARRRAGVAAQIEELRSR